MVSPHRWFLDLPRMLSYEEAIEIYGDDCALTHSQQNEEVDRGLDRRPHPAT